MKRIAKQFALCLENSGNEASLIVGKVYRIVSDTRAAKDDLVRVIDESGEDYLFDRSQFAFVDFPRSVRRKLAVPAHKPSDAPSARCSFQTYADDGRYARSELAIRMAVGSAPSHIIRFVAEFGMRIVVTGIVLRLATGRWTILGR